MPIEKAGPINQVGEQFAAFFRREKFQRIVALGCRPGKISAASKVLCLIEMPIERGRSAALFTTAENSPGLLRLPLRIGQSPLPENFATKTD